MNNSTLPIYSLDLTQLSKITTEQIDKWIAAYPYSHNLHALKILSAKARKVDEFDTILSTEIMYIPDRGHLKKLLENLDMISINEKAVIPDNIEESILTINKEPNKELKAINDSETEYDAIIDITSSNISTSENKPVEVAELINVPTKEEASEIIQEEEIDKLIEDSEQARISNSMEEKETHNISEKISFLNGLDEDQELSDFSKWLKSRDSGNVINNPVMKTEPIKTGAINEWEGIQEKILANYHTGALGKEEKQKKEPGDKKKKKLKPKIDETEVITESYALLLEQQGKYNKAIKIYEKLSLIIPEKTTYFADKIEYLKNK